MSLVFALDFQKRLAIPTSKNQPERAASGHAAAPPSSVMNARRFMLNMGTSSPVGWSALPATGRRRSLYRTLNLPQNGRQVLGADLNRSESRRGRPLTCLKL
jgi:hypothetical protein